MIGIPVAMWLNGKRNWRQILQVWILTLGIVAITALVFFYYFPITLESMFVMYLYIAIFKVGVYVLVLYLALTVLWQRIAPNKAILIIILAVAIDMIIASLLGHYLISTEQFDDWIAWMPHLGIW